MREEYIFNKQELLNEKVKEVEFCFSNGDFLKLDGKELVDREISLCDRLQFRGRGINFTATKSVLKFKISIKKPRYDDNNFICDRKSYIANRKEYIENRCVNESDLQSIKFYNDNNWHYSVFGNFSAKMENGYLIIKINGDEPSDSEFGKIALRPITINQINWIDLDFENCESIRVYQDEIKEVQLTYDENLEWDGFDLARTIKGGYIRIKLENLDYRDIDLFSCKKPSIKTLTKRICGIKKYPEHDICHLYIEFPYYHQQREQIAINDIRDDEELERLYNLEEELQCDIMDFIGGYAKQLEDESIVIAFGKNAQKTIDRFN